MHCFLPQNFPIASRASSRASISRRPSGGYEGWTLEQPRQGELSGQYGEHMVKIHEQIMKNMERSGFMT